MRHNSLTMKLEEQVATLSLKIVEEDEIMGPSTIHQNDEVGTNTQKKFMEFLEQDMHEELTKKPTGDLDCKSEESKTSEQKCEDLLISERMESSPLQLASKTTTPNNQNSVIEEEEKGE